MSERVCSKCGPKPLSEFTPGNRTCKACRRAAWQASRGARSNAQRRSAYLDPERKRKANEASKRYREKNRDALNAGHRTRHRNIREAVIQRYGAACACCGEKTYEFLAVDHVDGGGTKERAMRGAYGIYRKLFEAEGVLPGYRLLCHNCNSAKGSYGYCPHERTPDLTAPPDRP